MTKVRGREPLDVIAGGRVLPVVVVERVEDAGELVGALAAGGVRCVEVTFRTEVAAEVVAEMVVREPEMVVGAGTVLTAGQVDRAVEAGAKFVVTPGFGPHVVRRCQQLGIPVVPGVATATEIQQALDAGLDTVKFFPAAQIGGPAMLKALSAPFRSVRFVPTGGVTADTMADYLAVPSVVAVGGTWLAPSDLVAAGNWPEITRRTAAALAHAAE